MLYGALIAQAHIRSFQIEDDAAFFFVNRAVDHIYQINTSDQSRFLAAQLAIITIPAFLGRIQRETTRREFVTESNARNIIGSITYDCFYPWCSDVPP
jgi:hypothetical protein